MGSLQNMLNVYFHMKNHYRKLKNVQSRVNTNRTLKSAGKAKKVRSKVKDTTNILKENKERPPTRRNPNENLGAENVINAQGPKAKPLCNKFKTSALAQSSREKSIMNIEQHEYLQFSLHITEEIIRNDLFKNDEMLHVLKQHYQANKGRLNKDKLLKTIAELCTELNIPMDENIFQLLEDPRVCVAPRSNGYSPNISPSNVDHNLGQTHNGTNEKSYLSIYQEKLNTTQQLPDEKQLQFAQPYAVTATAVSEPTSNILELQPIISEEDTDDVVEDKVAFETDVIKEIDKVDNKDKTDNGSYEIIEMEKTDLCQFEFGEETLKAPGEDSIPFITSMNSKSKEFRDFHVLHDATAKFGDSERDSDASIAHKLTPVSTAESILSKQQIFVMNFDGLPKKPEKNLVVVHYATSVEPEQVQTKEFSVQAVLDDNVEKGEKFSLYDVSTQKNVSGYSDAEVDYAESDQNRAVTKSSQVTSNSEVNFKICNRCNCDRGNKIERENGLIGISEDSNAESGTCLSSNEAQYVLLDCPVLIPREHTKSMDFLNSIASRGGGVEKSFHTLNLRMPHNNFFANNSTSNVNSTTAATGLNGFNNAHVVSSNFKLEENSSQHNDYDLTPQKDMYQSKQKPAHIASFTSNTALGNHAYYGCSCISAGVNPSKLMTDKYDLKDPSKKSNTLDRLNRYRKVNENLSYFYPTIATQVSSMDLISTDLDVYHNQQSRLYQSKRANYEQRGPSTYKHQQCNEAPVADRLNKADNRQNYSSSSESPREYNGPLDSPGVVPNFSNLIKQNKNVGNNEHIKINLDNYRIDTRHQDNKKKMYEEATVDQDVDRYKQDKPPSVAASRGQTPTKSTYRSVDALQLNLPRESADNVGTHRSLGRYQSNDSMEMRIKTLRHDIEKYSKDDISTKRTTGTTRIESPRLLVDGLKQNSVILPSEVALPRHKKMSILRKLSTNN